MDKEGYLLIYRTRSFGEERIISQVLEDEEIKYFMLPSGTVESSLLGSEYTGTEVWVEQEEGRYALSLIKETLESWEMETQDEDESLSEEAQIDQAPESIDKEMPPENGRFSDEVFETRENINLRLWGVVLLAFLALLGLFLLVRHKSRPRYQVGRYGEIYQDFDHDGKADGWLESSSDGKKVTVFWDKNRNHIPEKVDEFYKGVQLRSWIDDQEDWDTEKVISYFPNGDVRSCSYDKNQNDISELVEEYYPHGILKARFKDEDEDGLFEIFEDYDPERRLRYLYEDMDKDDVYEVYKWYDYKGRLRAVGEDLNITKDGVYEKVSRFNEEGVLIMILYDTTGDAEYDKREYYDASGKLIKTGYDYDYDYEMDRWEYPGGE